MSYDQSINIGNYGVQVILEFLSTESNQTRNAIYHEAKSVTTYPYTNKIKSFELEFISVF